MISFNADIQSREFADTDQRGYRFRSKATRSYHSGSPWPSWNPNRLLKGGDRVDGVSTLARDRSA